MVLVSFLRYPDPDPYRLKRIRIWQNDTDPDPKHWCKGCSSASKNDVNIADLQNWGSLTAVGRKPITPIWPSSVALMEAINT